MAEFIESLAYILLNVADEQLTSEHNGGFAPSDVIYANLLLRQTIRSSAFRRSPTLQTLRNIIVVLSHRDSDLCAWAEKKAGDLGCDLFTKYLWITNATMPVG